MASWKVWRLMRVASLVVLCGCAVEYEPPPVRIVALVDAEAVSAAAAEWNAAIPGVVDDSCEECVVATVTRMPEEECARRRVLAFSTWAGSAASVRVCKLEDAELLEKVLVHELGHVLSDNEEHSADAESIMHVAHTPDEMKRARITEELKQLVKGRM